VTLGSGAASVFGGVGDTIDLGSVGQYADGGAGKLTIKLGTAGVDSVFGSSVASGVIRSLAAPGQSGFQPAGWRRGDLIDLSNSSGTAVINAFSAGSTQLSAVNDTIMAGTGSDSVWGGPGDRIGVGNSATAGGTHLFTHATTIPGASIGFGTNDAVFAATYGSTAGATTVNSVLQAPRRPAYRLTGSRKTMERRQTSSSTQANRRAPVRRSLRPRRRSSPTARPAPSSRCPTAP